MIRLHLRDLLDDGRVICRQASDLRQSLDGLIVLVLLNEEARSLRKKDEPDDQNEGPGELNGDRDAIGPCVLTISNGVIDDGGEEEALSPGTLAELTHCLHQSCNAYNRDSPLVSTHDRTTDPLWRSLTLVERNHCTDQPNTVSGEESSSNEQRLRSRRSLQDNSQVEDNQGGSQKSQSSTQEICHRSSCKCTEERSHGENGDNERVLGGRDSFVVSRPEHVHPVGVGEDTADRAGL